MSAATSLTLLAPNNVPSLSNSTTSPATALVPDKLTRTTGAVSSVRPPVAVMSLLTTPTSSMILLINGALGLVLSSVKLKLCATLALPALSVCCTSTVYTPSAVPSVAGAV